MKWKDSTRCLLDRLADGYNTQIQTEVDQRELGGEQRRTELAELRRCQTEELAELTELRGDSLQTVKTDTDKNDTGRQLK
jgi:hypothetical protein